MRAGHCGVDFGRQLQAALLPARSTREGFLRAIAVAAGGVDLEVAAGLVDVEDLGEFGEGVDAGAG